MRDPAKTDYQEAVEDALDSAAFAIEAKAVGIIASRLGTIDPDTRIAELLSHVSEDVAAIDRAVSKGGAELAKAAEASIEDMAESNDEWAKPFYEATGAVQTGAAAAVAHAYAKDAKRAVRAIVRTSAIGLAGADGTGFRPLKEAYVSILSQAASAMASGEQTGERAVRSAVRALCSGGLRVVYESGRTMELHSAVRMNVMDSFMSAMHEARKLQGEEYGADGVEVTAHGLCAPDHLPYQGRQFPKRKFEKLNASLERPIAEGYNCRHMVFPVLLGFSDPAYSESELDEIAELSNSKVTYELNGRKVTETRYEFSQRQRAMERSIRRARLDAYAAEKSGYGATEANRRVREMLRRYRTVSQQAGVDTRMERTKLYLPR